MWIERVEKAVLVSAAPEYDRPWEPTAPKPSLDLATIGAPDDPLQTLRQLLELAPNDKRQRRYLEFLARILEAETDEWARRSLEGTIKRLEEQIEQIDKR